jgi:hypothetical protein
MMDMDDFDRQFDNTTKIVGIGVKVILSLIVLVVVTGIVVGILVLLHFGII